MSLNFIKAWRNDKWYNIQNNFHLPQAIGQPLMSNPAGTSENWRRTSRSCITVVRWDKWKNQEIPKRADRQIYFHWYKILNLLTKDKFKFGAKLISDNFYVSVTEWFLFLYFKYWYFRSLKRFWDCDFNFVNVLELHQSDSQTCR
jgi:hypothetical protein